MEEKDFRFDNEEFESGSTPKRLGWKMTLLPPASDVCQECAVKHEEHQPHDATSLYFQYAFFGKHGKWPNWLDAMSHCSQEIKDMWIEELEQLGVDVHGGKVNPQKVSTEVTR